MHNLRTLFLVLALAGCGRVVHGDGTSGTDNRSVAAFTHLSVEDGLDVQLTDRSSDSVVVNGDENLLAYIATDVKGDTLTIHVKDAVVLDTKNTVTLEVGRASIDDLSASGGSKVHSDEGISCQAVGLHASGGSEILIDSATGTSLNIDASGGSHLLVRALNAPAGTIDLSGGSHLESTCGEVDDITIEVSGASHADLGAVLTKTANINASGGSQAELQATQSVQGDASGGSTVSVTGNPQARTLTTSGGSEVAYP